MNRTDEVLSEMRTMLSSMEMQDLFVSANTTRLAIKEMEGLQATITELQEKRLQAAVEGSEWKTRALRAENLADRHAAEINRRRGEMAVAREYLDERGVPKHSPSGGTLTFYQRLKRFVEAREVTE